MKPQDDAKTKISLTAKDSQGHIGRTSVELQTKKRFDDDSVLLRTNKSLYRTGEQVELSVYSTRKRGTVYLDLIKDRQTYLTRTLELKNGRTRDKITLDAMLAGTVQINAYFIGRNGVIVRDRRLVLVDPADDLSIKVSSDNETYLPGTEAKLKFKITNKRGKGVASALGVMVVDEAVFALQEMQPGLEKVYFYLEKEIATPRYEIHGYELDTCICPPIPVVGVRPMEARRDTAARVLLASAKGVGDYPLHVNTYERDNKAQAFQQKMAQHMMPRYQKVRDAFNKLAQKLKKDKISLKKGVNIDRLVEDGYLAKPDSLDPWGEVMKIEGRWCQNCQNYHGFVLLSAGIDGKWSTADDASVPAGVFGPRGQIRFNNGRRNWFGAMNGLAMDAAEVPMAMAGAPMKKALAITGPKSESSSEVGGGAEPIRIREYFPETLYFNPAVITDGRGRAVLNIPMADSITTWRLTCMASSATGQLGSTTAGIQVFQDFFVDIDFPVSLTQNDQIHVPIAIYIQLPQDRPENSTGG